MRLFLSVVLFLTGCTAANSPVSQHKFLDGISKTRSRENITVGTIYGKDWEDVDRICRDKIRNGGYFVSNPSAVLQISPNEEALPYPKQRYEECALVPKDKQVGNQQPYCDLVLLKGTKPGDPLYEHGMMHCIGYDHPF